MIYENLNFEYSKGKKQSNIKFVLLHGWGHCIENLKPIAKMLCDYDCYLVDLPGFGKSPIPTDVLSISDYSSIIADFIKGFKNKDDKVVVIGHSFGGRISLDLASNYPSLVNKIIIIAGAGLKKKTKIHKKLSVWGLQKINKICHIVYSIFGKNFSNTKLYDKLFNKLASNDYKNAHQMMRKILKKTIKTSSIPVAKKIKIQTLLIYGANDTTTPPYFGKKLNKLIKNSKLFILPTFTHNSILTDGRFQVSSIILKNIGE